MARIREYGLDRDLEIQDKVLGTDYTDGSTMNFSIEQLGAFLASRGLADPSALDFQFQFAGVGEPDTIRDGEIYYDSTAPIALTRVWVSNVDLKGLDSGPFASYIQGSVLEINDAQSSVGTDYGFYDVVEVDDSREDGFVFTVALHMPEGITEVSSTASVPQTEYVNLSIIGFSGSQGEEGVDGDSIRVVIETDDQVTPNTHTVSVYTTDGATGIEGAPEVFEIVDGVDGTNVTARDNNDNTVSILDNDGAVVATLTGGLDGRGITSITPRNANPGLGQSTTIDVVYSDGLNPDSFIVASGEKGESGDDAALDGDGIGTVTGVDPVNATTYGDAEVTLNGDAQNISFDFAIPRGLTGDTGHTGPYSARVYRAVANGTDPTTITLPVDNEFTVNIESGLVTPETGASGWTTLKTHTTSQTLYVLEVQINPAVDTAGGVTDRQITRNQWGQVFAAGSQGIQGNTGDTPSISVSATNVDLQGDGSLGTATATRSGASTDTDENPEIVFGIPVGEQGDTGESLDSITRVTSESDDTENTSAPVQGESIFIKFDGDDGTDFGTFEIPSGTMGDQGSPGPQGILNYIIYHDVRQEDRPARPSDTQWTLTGGEQIPVGWTLSIPDGGGQLWETRASVDPADGDTATLDWQTPVKTGGQGPAGQTGADGDSITADVDTVTNPGEALLTIESVDGVTGDATPIIEDFNIKGADGASVQGPEGRFTVFIFADSDVVDETVAPANGTYNVNDGTLTLPANWTEIPPSDMTTPALTGDLYETRGTVDAGRSTPDGSGNIPISWSVPFAAGSPGASGAPGAPGPGLDAGGTVGQIAVKDAAADYETTWTSFNTGTAGDVDVTFQVVAGTGITATVNRSDFPFVPLNPSGGGGGTTTDNAWAGVQASEPTAFVPNAAPLTERTLASDGQVFDFDYSDLNGDLSDIWFIVNLPNDLTDGHTLSFIARDTMTGTSYPLLDVQSIADTTYTSYYDSFGDNIEIIIHIA